MLLTLADRMVAYGQRQQGGGAGAAGKAVEPNSNQLTIQNSGQVVGSTS